VTECQEPDTSLEGLLAMSSERVPRHSHQDDLEQAAERASRDLPGQIARVQAQVREARRKLLADAGESPARPAATRR
jgi:hypothetical protein